MSDILSPAELGVLRLLSDGSTSKQIAVFTRMSARTIEDQLHNIRKVLNASTTAHALAKAFREGLIQ